MMSDSNIHDNYHLFGKSERMEISAYSKNLPTCFLNSGGIGIEIQYQ